jgi:putative heme-binding domain-containing protein
MSLARRDLSQLPHLIGLLEDREPAVQLEAARALRMVASEPAVKKALQKASASQSDAVSPLAQQLHFALLLESGTKDAHKRPASPAAWRAAVATGGNAESGERLFLHTMTGCTVCHQAQGRGVYIGPDLSHVARSLDRNRLIDAILEPSREVAPQYEHHIVTTKTGAVYSGVLVHTALDGAPLMDALGAGRLRVSMAQVVRHDTSPLSLMPPGLENIMTVQDFRDLLAYLLTLK